MHPLNFSIQQSNFLSIVPVPSVTNYLGATLNTQIFVDPENLAIYRKSVSLLKCNMRIKNISILLLISFICFSSSAAFGSAVTAFNKLDSATTKIVSAQLFLYESTIDYAATDNNLRKAKLDLGKVFSNAKNGAGKLNAKSLLALSKSLTKINANIDAARNALKSKKVPATEKQIEKAIKNLEVSMRIIRGLSAGTTACSGTFSAESAGAPNIFKTHVTFSCPLVYDEIRADFVFEEIGSLSYGYSNFSAANEDAGPCSSTSTKNLGICTGIPGRPGGNFAMRLNVYLVAGVPDEVHITALRHGQVVALDDDLHAAP